MEVMAAVGLHPNHSPLMPVNEPTWPHSTSSKREDEIDHQGCDHDETAQRSTSCMMDALMSQSYTGSSGKTGSSIWCAMCGFSHQV